MSLEMSLLDHAAQIRKAATESEDGQRCMVAAHPDLQQRMQQELTQLRASLSSVAAPFLAMGEPSRPGLNDGLIVPPELFPLGTPMSSIRSAAADRAPLRGALRVIVVLVDFADKPMTQTKAHYQNLFFSTGAIATKSVREYYADVTHGLIDIQGDVVGPFRLPKKLSEYANGGSGMGPATPNATTMARDALLAADPSVNFTPYDNDGDGFVDAFIVIHAGAGAEVTGLSTDIWSHKWVLDGGAHSADSTKVFAYLTVPEDCKIGVCCHELGHLLFGFPDLYDTTGASEGIGNWCLMAAGSWGGGGDTPVHPSAWCKANQGWATVDNHTSAGVIQIPDVKNSHSVIRLWKNGGSGSEYFLLENRQQVGFDASLPGSGLLIFHIDEAISGNTNFNHYKVALMQADGKRDLEHHGNNRGDAGDPYPGSSNNTSFNPASNPNSKSYSGVDTCVTVSGISPPSAVMTATLRVSCVLKSIKEGHKELAKDFKESHKELVKEKDVIRDKVFDGKLHILDKFQEKPVTDKSAGLDKGFGDKGFESKPSETGGVAPGAVGTGPPNVGDATLLSRIEARLVALESLMGQKSGEPTAAPPQPFIGQELRPDLSQGALLSEQDVANTQQQMRLGSVQAKRLYDTSPTGR